MHFTLDTKKSGIVELDNENKVVAFLEKPDPTTTSSRWAVSNGQYYCIRSILHIYNLK